MFCYLLYQLLADRQKITKTRISAVELIFFISVVHFKIKIVSMSKTSENQLSINSLGRMVKHHDLEIGVVIHNYDNICNYIH